MKSRFKKAGLITSLAVATALAISPIESKAGMEVGGREYPRQNIEYYNQKTSIYTAIGIATLATVALVSIDFTSIRFRRKKRNYSYKNLNDNQEE